MTVSEVTKILERLAVIETKIDNQRELEDRIHCLERVANRLIGALMLVGFLDVGVMIKLVGG